MNPIVAVFLVLALTSCGSPAAPGAKTRAPTELIDGLQSYTSPSSLRASFPGTVDWRVIEDSKLPSDDPRPRFDILVVSVPWKYSGYSGELHLHFVNELLDATWFYPDEPEDFFRSTPLELPSNISRRTRIYRGTSYDGREYIAWEDTALAEEQRAWIRRFA